MEKIESRDIPNRLYFKIGEVADIVGVEPYVLRYWETEFSFLHPSKSASGQRLYKRGDLENLLTIKHLLYEERFSIEGAKKRSRELKRDGDLKEFQKEKILSPSEDSIPKEAADQILKAAKDLDRVLRRPIQDFFKL